MTQPSKRIAVVACMDARLDPYQLLGLAVGEAHMIRNAGGVVTNDVIRSLCLSQIGLSTREVALIHHTECGLSMTNEAQFLDDLADSTGQRPEWTLNSFDDPFINVAESMKLITESPFIPHTDKVTGYVFDVATGELIEVDPA